MKILSLKDDDFGATSPRSQQPTTERGLRRSVLFHNFLLKNSECFVK